MASRYDETDGKENVNDDDNADDDEPGPAHIQPCGDPLGRPALDDLPLSHHHQQVPRAWRDNYDFFDVDHLYFFIFHLVLSFSSVQNLDFNPHQHPWHFFLQWMLSGLAPKGGNELKSEPNRPTMIKISQMERLCAV